MWYFMHFSLAVLDLGSSAERRGGSSPLIRTNFLYLHAVFFVFWLMPKVRFESSHPHQLSVPPSSYLFFG